jgi:triosephosphate isomerase (TIM)
MRRPIVAGNWKMHGSNAANAKLLADLDRRLRPEWPIDLIVCPPYVYLSDTVRTLGEGFIAVGAQNLSAEPSGAFTGEVSGPMLKDIGCRYVIVGHSERRRLYHEDDALIARKFTAALGAGLVPILCLGETLEEREANQTEAVVSRHLDAVLRIGGAAAFAGAVLAYEPVWAIGTGRNATPQQAQDVHAFVRGRIAAQDAKIGAALRILYGGSVKASNAAELFAMPDVDGGLVGGASLSADEFEPICAAAAQRARRDT